MKARAAQVDPTAGMNKTEARFYRELLAWPGEMLPFEGVTFRLAQRTRYTPDFGFVHPTGALTFYEVKGFWRDDARAKIKMAAQTFPFLKFVAVTYEKKTWQYEDFSPVGIVGTKGELK